MAAFVRLMLCVCVCVCPLCTLILLVDRLPPVDVGHELWEREPESLSSDLKQQQARGWAQTWLDCAAMGEPVVALVNGPIWLVEWWRKARA